MEILDEKVQNWVDSARFVKSKPGVYVFYDGKLTPLFIGAAENLQKQFTQYLDSNFEYDPCKQKTYSYQRIFKETPFDKKNQLLSEYENKHGSKPICN